MKIGLVLLAAGNSERFRGNKLLADFAGQPLISRAFDAVPEETETVVVTQYPEIEKMASDRGFRSVRNGSPELGVSRSVRLGTEALRHCDAVVYCVSDQPLLRKETVSRLIAFWKEQPERICALAHCGQRGNPCVFPKKYFPELMRLEGDTGGGAVIRRHPEALRLLEAPADQLLDADTREALLGL